MSVTQALRPAVVPADSLDFDLENPRLAEYGLSDRDTPEKILRILWDAMDVREIVQSISASGYFPHEPLIVIPNGKRFTVIEGNRRLAAVKIILDPSLAKDNSWDIHPPREEIIKSLFKLPVMVTERSESWRYLGFKHVNGPAKWSSFSKSQYIATVHRSYGIPLAEIANQIGDRHRTVQRLYRGLMVIEQAKDAKVYDIEDKYRPRFAFSHLYTGLDYDGISSFVDINVEDDESPTPIPRERLPELGELFVWLYGSRRENRPPVVESQNPDLRNLNTVIKSRDGISALRAGKTLDFALELSRPPRQVFEEALTAAKRDLTSVRGYLTSGYDGTEDLLRMAGTVAEMADDIYSEMERKRSGGKKSRLTLEP